MDQIYAAYGGGSSVTRIIDLLGEAKCTGTIHPDLVI
jgi:hypothetical protein